MKSFIWKQYTVQITKKNVKNTNVRIKRDNPHVILMSIPYSATYKAGLRALETPHIRHWLDNYERKLKQQPVPTDEEKFRKELEKEKWHLLTATGFWNCFPVCFEMGADPRRLQQQGDYS